MHLVKVRRRLRRLSAPLRLLIIFLTLLILITLTLLISLIGSDHEPRYDFFIVSTTYYQHSKSFPNDTAVIVFNADAKLDPRYTYLKVQSTGPQGTEENSFEIHPIMQDSRAEVCKWITYVAIGHTIPNATTASLMLKKFAVPVLIFSLESFAQFGAFGHLYVRSAISEVFELLRYYEKEEYIRVAPWSPLKLGDTTGHAKDWDPNLEVEFRNQPAAQTDCLLLYKEAAEFIFFVDFDDLLLPAGNAKSYVQEFQKRFAPFPYAVSMHYHKEHMHFSVADDPNNFDLGKSLRSLRLSGKGDEGKKFVVRPRHAHGTWIHYPVVTTHGYTRQDVSIRDNHVLHLKYQQETHEWSADAPRLTFLKDEALKKLVAGFKDRYEDPRFRRIFTNLPTKPFYAPLIEECFQETFYAYLGTPRTGLCPGPARCRLPDDHGIDCVVSEGEYSTAESPDPDRNNTYLLDVHLHLSSRFTTRRGCLID